MYMRRALLLSSLCACAQPAPPQNPKLLLTVEGLSPELRTLRVRAALNGKPSKALSEVPTGGAASVQIGLDLPAGTSGKLALTVDAVPEPRFVAASGGVEVLVPEQGEAQVTLSRRPVCSTVGWCWEQPMPTGRILHNVWATPRGDVWAVGTHGTILHQQDGIWEQTPSPVDVPLYGIWATGPDDAWAVGDKGTVLRWQRTAWTEVTWWDRSKEDRKPSVASFVGVWGDASSRWIVGGGGVVLLYDGSRWSRRVFPDHVFYGVAGAGEGTSRDVWVVGWKGSPAVGQILHLRGPASDLDRLAQVAFPAPEGVTLSGVTALPSGEAWAVGPKHLLAWNPHASAWTRMEPPAGITLPQVQQITEPRVLATGPKSLWVLGYANLLHIQDGKWSEELLDPLAKDISPYGLAGRSDQDLWTVGHGGVIQHHDGTRFKAVLGREGKAPPYLHDISGTGPQDIWAVGERGTILHHDGTGWTDGRTGRECEPLKGQKNEAELRGVWARSSKDVWAVGYPAGDNLATILRWDGSCWSRFAPPPGVTRLMRIWGNKEDPRVWTAGPSATDMGTMKTALGTIISWDQMSGMWQPSKVPEVSLPTGVTRIATEISGLWGSGPRDLWAVGYQTLYTSTTSTVAGFVLRSDSSGWADLSASVKTDLGIAEPKPLLYLYTVAGSGPQDIWISEQNNNIRYDGKKWQAVSGAWYLCTNLLVRGPTDVYCVHNNASLYHYTGSPLQFPVPTGFNHPRALWASGDSMWLVGWPGAVLRCQGARCGEVP